MKYFSLFLPTSRDIPPEKSWKLWLPEFNMFWSTWSNSPAWEVDLLKLYNRLAFHQVSVAACKPEMLQHVLVHLEQLTSLGGGPAQALQQACLPSG
jgi:hypothetical protein